MVFQLFSLCAVRLFKMFKLASLTAAVFLAMAPIAQAVQSQRLQVTNYASQISPGTYYAEDDISLGMSEADIETLVQNQMSQPNHLVRSIAISQSLQSQLEVSPSQQTQIANLVAKLDAEINTLGSELRERRRGLKSAKEIEKVQFEIRDKVTEATSKVIEEIRDEILVPSQLELIDQIGQRQTLKMLSSSTRRRADWGLVLSKYLKLDAGQSQSFNAEVKSVEKDLAREIQKAKLKAAKKMLAALPEDSRKELIKRIGDDEEKLVEVLIRK